MKTSKSSRSFSGRAFALAVALPFLSGAAALSHELLWTRRLIDLLGATDWVVGRVLGLFFFGISLGGYLATLQSNRIESPAITLSKFEILIGILALPAAFLPFWTDWIWPALGTELLVSWIGWAIKLFLTILVVMPPAVAMGFTLPLFIRSAARLGSSISSVGVWIYAVNTLGGVFGLWLTSCYLLDWFGAQGSMILTSMVNVTVGFFLWVMFRLEANPTEPTKDEPSRIRRPLEAEDRKSSRLTSFQLYFLSFASGFMVLALEVLLFRLIALVVPSSYHTTSALLANVILILAVGSGLISLLNSFPATKKLVTSRWTIVGILFCIASCVVMCPSFLYVATDQLISIRYLQGLKYGLTINSPGHYWQLVFWLVACSGGLALLFSGLVFPTLLSISTQTDSVGRKVGLLLAVNGIGGLAGTEFFNTFVISAFGIYGGFIVLASVIFGLISVFIFIFSRWAVLPVSLILGLIIFSGYQSVSDLPYLSPRAKGGVQVNKRYFGRDGVWLIVTKRSGSRGILVNNQYYLGGSGASVVQRRELLFPWILNPKCQSVCVLGLATGITSSGLELLDNPPPVTAVELSSNVVKLSKKYFQKESGEFFQRGGNRVITEDARTYMAAASNHYDLIVGDLYRPFGIGEGRLYSLQHFQNVRRALSEDGVFCQWLPAYQLNEENFLTISATFQKVFPETLVLYGDPDLKVPVIGLIGRKNNKKWDPAEIEARLANIPTKAIQADPILQNARSLVAGVLKKDGLRNQKINTLDNLVVEISAGNHWIQTDLRKKRSPAYEKEFLSGKNVIRFHRKLEELIDPVLPPAYFKKLLKLMEQKAVRMKTR